MRSAPGRWPSTILVLLVSIASILSAPARPARAQALQLQGLELPANPKVGPWVRYRVRTQTRSRPVREYTQRVAIVAKERADGRVGYWVELKTEGQPSGIRIERGFFFPPVTASAATSDDESESTPSAPSNVDPKVATPAEIARIRALQTGNQVQGITGGLQVKEANPK